MADVSQQTSSQSPVLDKKGAGIWKRMFRWGSVVLIILVLISAILPAIMGGGLNSHQYNPDMQNARSIGLLLFQYSIDHDNKYPTGKSSTEIFQKLIDEKYVNDPSIFYFKMPGKTKAASNVLKPENVSWDVTAPLDANSPDQTPLVFMTGYRINYAPGGSAVLIPGVAQTVKGGLAVCYKGNNAAFKRDDSLPGGTVTNFVPANFDPAGKEFQQLTPNGPILPP